ncbi:MAG: gliding motility-associated C-terminal domain-containing protein, partial [Bacteroidota bacterium]
MKYLVALLFLFFLPLSLFATHNRAGEIIVEYQGECGSGNTVCATIITYTERFSMADRDSLPIDWGDGTFDVVGRTDITVVDNNIQRNEYTLCHNYDGPGTYFIFTEDPNRIAGILNVNFPNSVQVPFSIFTVYTLTNSALFGCNSSPVLQQPPLDNACVGEVWTHNPGAFDPDGDSLSFEFTTPLVSQGVPVPNYRPVNEVEGTGTLSIDPSTGQIEWAVPNEPGPYNLAFLVISYRDGFPLDTMIRDMQIFVDDCMNDPPTVDVPVEEICVVAGELIEFDVVAGAPVTDVDQLVRLQANGGPFILDNSPAEFTPTNQDGYQQDPLTRTFRWQTNCEHIRAQPYFVVFRGEDNFFSGNSGLSTIKTVSIKVVAPPPENLVIEEDIGLITLTWDLPYACETVESIEFTGFSVWRREGSNPFAPDTCETGLDGRGYTLLNDIPTQEVDGGRYIFFDEDVDRGKTYCYRVLANFVRREPINDLIFEKLESIPSEEVCAQLPRDIPLLVKVDVLETSNTTGQIDVCWIRPNPAALDTLLNAGPYRYVLSRAPGINATGGFEVIATSVVQNFSDPIDTCFVDTGLDTETTGYSYTIELFVNNEPQPLDAGEPSSSVFLGAGPTDQAVDLSWEENVSWTNFAYDVFRRLPGATDYDSLTTVSDNSFRDEGLVNGETYCYFIRSVGTYGVEDLPDTLLNRSQEVCVEPRDNVPPCPPELSVSSVCERGGDCLDEDNLFNGLSWVAPIDICDVGDVGGYRVYFAANEVAEPMLIADLQGSETLNFDHFPEGSLVGCYYVTALDTAGNESAF